MLFHISIYTKTCSKNMLILFCLLIIFLQGIWTHISLNLSTIQTNSHVTFSLSKTTKKSTNMFFKDLVDIGTRWYRLCFILLGLQEQWSINSLIYKATYSWILNKDTYLYKLETIFPTSKCPTTLKLWTSLRNENISPLHATCLVCKVTHSRDDS